MSYCFAEYQSPASAKQAMSCSGAAIVGSEVSMISSAARIDLYLTAKCKGDVAKNLRVAGEEEMKKVLAEEFQKSFNDGMREHLGAFHIATDKVRSRCEKANFWQRFNYGILTLFDFSNYLGPTQDVQICHAEYYSGTAEGQRAIRCDAVLVVSSEGHVKAPARTHRIDMRYIDAKCRAVGGNKIDKDLRKRAQIEMRRIAVEEVLRFFLSSASSV